MEDVESALKTFGLTEYETRAYLTLLKLGVTTAENISIRGNIPLPRVYDTLVELQKKGFVLISKDRPKKFKPVNVEKALNNLIEIKKANMEKELKELKTNVKEIAKDLAFVEPIEKTEKEWNIWSTEKRENVVRTLNEQITNATKEVVAFSGDMSWLPESIPALKHAIKKGISIRVVAGYVKHSKELAENLRRAKKIGLKVKTGYTGTLRGYVVDDKIAAIALKSSEKDLNLPKNVNRSELTKKYELVILDNPAFAVAFKENFEHWWKKLK